jgi:EAL domain-containing protein (putative c-di-GMP-specific phosphodiesterase class I)
MPGSLDAPVCVEGASLAPSLPELARSASLCFIIDPDFGFLRAFSKRLRDMGIDTVESISGTRLAENVDSQKPDIVFLDLDPAHPSECARALMSLRECRFDGRIQLLGHCKLPLLEDFRKLGTDASLAMLPVLQKPVDFAAVQKIILEQKLNCATIAPPELSLKTALAHDYITFWYQPKIDLAKRQVVGAEAFARIEHPQHGMLPPARFLAGAAEDDRLELALRALDNALELGCRLEGLGIGIQIAVNASAETIMKLPVSELILKYRPANDTWPGLVFDVPEAQVIHKVTVLRERFQELNKCGVFLAVDNFGRGNSSFSMFRYLPFQEIKIDPSFVQGCAANRGNADVCKSMIQVAHNFGRRAVAMGIETAEDAAEVGRLNCDFAQGYLFGKPMRDRQLVTMIMAGRAQSLDFCNSNVWDVDPVLVPGPSTK